eukprot:CAMPEP_0177727760 /NCGR_PEP_ID=MMETSP0484_2-20121128/20497_1 /TAXON_ID=354590 /ORGANISM="Rhodomonas lens, Strain RHODO" /LENGTH=84 /DNA_ID=CAMNT_0019240443 /DNA_START=633 /DNA_END=887 /DNA_ORIENTATION=-
MKTLAAAPAEEETGSSPTLSMQVMRSIEEACQYPNMILRTESLESKKLKASSASGLTTKNATANRKSSHTKLRTHNSDASFNAP